MSEETTFQRVKRIMQQPDDMPEVEPSSFELFLIHHRPICEVGTCMKPTVRIVSPHKNPVAVCEEDWEKGIQR